MSKSYTIAQAKNQLSQLVHQVEAFGPIELTRRGRSVAVVVSTSDYERFGAPRHDLFDVIQELRSQADMEALAIDPDEIFDSVRDRSVGRDFSW